MPVPAGGARIGIAGREATGADAAFGRRRPGQLARRRNPPCRHGRAAGSAPLRWRCASLPLQLGGPGFGRRHGGQQFLQGRQLTLALRRIGDVVDHQRLETVARHQGQQPVAGHVQRPAGGQQALGAELRQLDDPLAQAQFRIVDLLQDAVFGQEVGEDHLDHVQQLRPDIAGKLGGAEQRVGIAQHLHLLDGVRPAIDEAADQPWLGGHVVERFQHQAGLALGHRRMGQGLDIVDLASRLSHQGQQPAHRLLQAGQPALFLRAGMARRQRLGHFRPAFHALFGHQPLQQRHEGRRLGVARRSLGVVELDLDMQQGRLPGLGQPAGVELVGECAQVVGQRGQQG